MINEQENDYVIDEEHDELQAVFTLLMGFLEMIHEVKKPSKFYYQELYDYIISALRVQNPETQELTYDIQIARHNQPFACEDSVILRVAGFPGCYSVRSCHNDWCSVPMDERGESVCAGEMWMVNATFTYPVDNDDTELIEKCFAEADMVCDDYEDLLEEPMGFFGPRIEMPNREDIETFERWWRDGTPLLDDDCEGFI